MIQMKKMAAAVALAAAAMGGAHAAALDAGVLGTSTLAAGDLSFSGWIQTSGVYGYGFTTFVDIAAGTNIYFTDMPWKGAMGTDGGWSNSTSIEGLYQWTVGSGGVKAGSQLFVSLNTAPVSTAVNYVANGVYDDLTFQSTTSTAASAGVLSAVANGTTTMFNSPISSTSNTAIGTSDTFYIYQGSTQSGTVSGGAAVTLPSISTLIAVGSVNASATVGSGDNVIGVAGQSASTSTTTTALNGTGITLQDLTTNVKKGLVYKGPTDFTVVGSTVEGVTIVDEATSKLAAQKSFLDLANYNEAGNTAAFSLITTASQTFTGINTNDVQILAVPEASTYAMLLAGLGMIGFMARRRSV
jgi:hypothetical protein